MLSRGHQLDWSRHSYMTPRYLGGAKDGVQRQIDAAYHQLITNAWRRRFPYGRPKPSMRDVEGFADEVYRQYPIPPNAPTR